MSKSYNNVIPLFCDENRLKKLIFSIATNAKNVGEPKYAEECTAIKIFKCISTEHEYNILIKDMENGIGWKEVKQRIFEHIVSLTIHKKALYLDILHSKNIFENILHTEENLNKIANNTLLEILDVIGVNI